MRNSNKTGKRKKEKKKSLNKVETFLADKSQIMDNYINFSILNEKKYRATVAQLGRASALGADVLADVRVRILNLDESPGGGVQTILIDVNIDYKKGNYENI